MSDTQLFKPIDAERRPTTYGIGTFLVDGQPKTTDKGYVSIPIRLEPIPGTNGVSMRFNLMFREEWFNGSTPESRADRFVYRRSVASSDPLAQGFLEALAESDSEFASLIASHNGTLRSDDIYSALCMREGATIGYRVEQRREKYGDTWVRTDRTDVTGFFAPTEDNVRRLEQRASNGRIRLTWKPYADN